MEAFQLRATLWAGVVPVPVNDSAVGAFVALLAKVRLADAVPVAAGAKVTVNPSDCPAAMVAGNVIPESTNSLLLLLADDTVTEALVALRLPLKGELDPTGTLPKLKAGGETESCPGVVAVPESPMVSGEFEASDTTDKLPLAAPALVGANVAVKVTLPPAVSAVGKVRLVSEKAEPLTLACEMFTVVPPVLVTVSEWLLVLPTWILPKPRLVGLAANDPGVGLLVPLLEFPATLWQPTNRSEQTLVRTVAMQAWRVEDRFKMASECGDSLSHRGGFQRHRFCLAPGKDSIEQAFWDR